MQEQVACVFELEAIWVICTICYLCHPGCRRMLRTWMFLAWPSPTLTWKSMTELPTSFAAAAARKHTSCTCTLAIWWEGVSIHSNITSRNLVVKMGIETIHLSRTLGTPQCCQILTLICFLGFQSGEKKKDDETVDSLGEELSFLCHQIKASMPPKSKLCLKTEFNVLICCFCLLWLAAGPLEKGQVRNEALRELRVELSKKHSAGELEGFTLYL